MISSTVVKGVPFCVPLPRQLAGGPAGAAPPPATTRIFNAQSPYGHENFTP